MQEENKLKKQAAVERAQKLLKFAELKEEKQKLENPRQEDYRETTRRYAHAYHVNC